MISRESIIGLGVLAVGIIGVVTVGAIVRYSKDASPVPISQGERIVLLGDSIGVGMSKAFVQILAQHGIAAESYATVGWTALSVRKMLDARQEVQGDVAVISLGSNDAAMVDPTVEREALDAISTTLFSRGFRRVVVVLGPNYALDASQVPLPATKQKQEVFSAMVDATQGFELFLPPPSVVSYLAQDRVHLPPKGYEELATVVVDFLSAL